MAKANKPEKPPKIQVTRDGPHLVSGNLPMCKEIIVPKAGFPYRWEKGEKFPAQETYALCRCGNSANKPFCTGTHTAIKFNDGDKRIRK